MKQAGLRWRRRSSGTAMFNGLVSGEAFGISRENVHAMIRSSPTTWWTSTIGHHTSGCATRAGCIHLRPSQHRCASGSAPSDTAGLARVGRRRIHHADRRIRGFRAVKPDFELAVLTPAGDLPHDERPDDFNVILSTWLNRLSLSSAHTPGTLPGTHEVSQLTSPL